MMKYLLHAIVPIAIIGFAIITVFPEKNNYGNQRAQVASFEAELLPVEVELIVTFAPTNITQTSATLQGRAAYGSILTQSEKMFSDFVLVYPNNELKSYGYGYRASTYSSSVNNLTCGTTYSYQARILLPRLATGNLYGAPVSFTTLPCTVMSSPRITTFSANPNSINGSGKTILSWNTVKATSCTIQGLLQKPVFSTNGTVETQILNETTTFNLVCTDDQGGQDSKQLVVNVDQAVGISVVPVITSFTVTPNTVQGSGTVRIVWNSVNINGCMLEGFSGSEPAGTRTDFITTSKTYALICYGINNQIIEQSRTVTVIPATVVQNPQINQFSASPAIVVVGNPATLVWNTTNTNTCRIDGESVGINSLRQYTLYSSRQFTLICTSSDGQSASQNIFVNVNQNNGDGNTEGSQNSPIIGYMNVSPLSVQQGGYANIYWNSDADYCIASGAWPGQKSASGSERVGPINSNQTYTLICYKNGRTAQQSVTAFREQETNIGTQNTSALTSVPTRIRAKNADVNGIALIGNGAVTQGWFEWGATRNLGNKTDAQFLGTNRTVDFNSTIRGLSPNTQYFYRALIQNKGGTYRGDIVSFNTERIVTNTQTTFVRQPVNTARPITQVRTIATQARAVTPNPAPTLQSQTYGRPVFIELTTTQVSPQVSPSANVEYRIQYRNITSTLLTNTAIKVVLPEEFEYVSATRGIYSSENKTLTLFLGDVQSREENTFTVIGRVIPTAQIGKTVVVTGYANYTIPKTNQFAEYQDEVIAYTLSLIQVGNVAGVSQAAGVGTTGNTFWRSDTGRAFAWLLLFLILLIILYLARKIYKTFKKV